MSPGASGKRIVLINPNSAQATTDMMVAIARGAAGDRAPVASVTATRAPAMIMTPRELDAAANEVVELGLAQGPGCLGFIVGAFGDPGLEELRQTSGLPCTGLCEASMRAAHGDGRRFGVATVTPELTDAIAARARDLGLASAYTGLRCTPGDPRALVADAGRLRAELADVVKACIALDGAEAVIIGGGPLGQAAADLQPMFSEPIIAPIPSAVWQLLDMINLP